MVSRSTMRVKLHSCVFSYLGHLPCIKGQADLYHNTVRLCVCVCVCACVYLCARACLCVCARLCVFPFHLPHQVTVV
jgi:hypothetical protein